ncbi:MAG: hypothetical protein LC800_22455 [Acidobacteria bacterium]|nr:hypothetical protein [Acidobacteriota bacterium]
MAKPRISANPGFSAALVEPSARAEAPICLSVRFVSAFARAKLMRLMSVSRSSSGRKEPWASTETAWAMPTNIILKKLFLIRMGSSRFTMSWAASRTIWVSPGGASG